MRRFGCHTRVVAGTLLLTRLKLRGVRPRAVSIPPNQLERAVRGKASVASERPPEGGHAASRQLHYPKQHPVGLSQATSSGVVSSHIQWGCLEPHPAGLSQVTRALRVPGTRSTSPPNQLRSAARGKASVASERPPEGGHAAPRQLQYPKQHPALLSQPTPSFVIPSHTQLRYPDPHPAELPHETARGLTPRSLNPAQPTHVSGAG